MAAFKRWDVVVAEFPYSDMSGSKRRPALIVSNMQGDDYIICQITGTIRDQEPNKVALPRDALIGDTIRVDSYIRPGLLMTVRSRCIASKIGRLPADKIQEVKKMLCRIFDIDAS